MDDESTVSSLSQQSQVSACGLEKREQLNIFLDHCNISPVKEKHIALHESGKKTVDNCISKGMQCLRADCDVICPGEGHVLMQKIIKILLKASAPAVQTDEHPNTDKILRDVYCSAESWSVQRQVLSIISKDRSFSEVKKVFLYPWNGIQRILVFLSSLCVSSLSAAKKKKT